MPKLSICTIFEITSSQVESQFVKLLQKSLSNINRITHQYKSVYTAMESILEQAFEVPYTTLIQVCLKS